MTSEVFTGNFTQQEPIPEAAIEAAVAVMRSGRLHRYNTLPGETGEVALLEAEFAAFTGARYALAVASGGYALGCGGAGFDQCVYLGPRARRDCLCRGASGVCRRHRGVGD